MLFNIFLHVIVITTEVILFNLKKGLRYLRFVGVLPKAGVELPPNEKDILLSKMCKKLFSNNLSYKLTFVNIT